MRLSRDDLILNCVKCLLQIDNLNKIVAVQKESLDKFKAAKQIQDKEIQELHGMVCRNSIILDSS